MTASSITIAIEGPCAALADEADLRATVLHTLAAEGIATPVALTVVLVDDPTIHDLNRRFLDHDEPTDVITFPLDDDAGAGDEQFVLPGEGAFRQLGEIYVSCERAAAQSSDWGGDPSREVRFLVVHGVLHLLGWDDATAEDRARMLARQEAILADWAVVGQG
jgi:probable rRNA maturation factor